MLCGIERGKSNKSSLRKCHHGVHHHFVTFAVLSLNSLAFQETMPRLIELSQTLVYSIICGLIVSSVQARQCM